MTKDRRLGRGLAALLGSPLDEDSIVDSVTGAQSAHHGSASGLPPSGQPATRQPASRQTVTGSVPLSAMASHSGKNQQNLLVPTAASNTPPKSNTPGGSMVDLTEEPTANRQASEVGKTLHLSVLEIDNNPFQPRRKFNEEEIASLAASIREHEQLQPILVRRVGQRYQLISGERRLRAAIHAGLKTIRAEVREADDRLVAELAIVENLQRKDLDAIEKALSFRRYIDQHECSQEQLAKRLKIDRSTVTNMMRLLELPQELQQWIQAETITVGHAKALLSLDDERQQIEFGRLIQAEGWSVRETERRVNAALDSENSADPTAVGSTTKSQRKRTSPQIASLEQQMRLSLGTKTEIRQNASGSGKITISFANNAEFERLYALICPEISKQRVA